jgi:carbon starvation protein
LEELAESVGITPMKNRFVATVVAVGVSGAIALLAGEKPGTGGLVLWPLFGATNQLLAGLALMVATFYLARRSRSVAIVAIPMMLMMIMPAWAMTYDLMFNWIPARKYTLIAFGFTILGLQAWMVVEGVMLYRKIRGVEEPRAELPRGFKKPALASGS